MINLIGDPLRKWYFQLVFSSLVPSNRILPEDLLIYFNMADPKLHRKLVSEKEIAPKFLNSGLA